MREFWLHSNGMIANHEGCEGADVWCKPRRVAVIDPDDREQVDRLSASYDIALRYEGTVGPTVDESAIAMQAALREFANPTPPKPEEPMGLGAVVEDADGDRWVRVNVATGMQEWRCCDADGEFRRWVGVDAVRVLSEGVSDA